MVSTSESGRIRPTTARAASPTAFAFVAMTYRSQAPTSSACELALIPDAVRSPPGPSSRRPTELMVLTWSCQLSTAQTSCPASAIITA